VSKDHTKSNTTDQTEPILSGADFHELLYQQIQRAVRTVLESVMKAELSEFLAAGFKERSSQRQGQRNGYELAPLLWSGRRQGQFEFLRRNIIQRGM